MKVPTWITNQSPVNVAILAAIVLFGTKYEFYDPYVRQARLEKAHQEAEDRRKAADSPAPTTDSPQLPPIVTGQNPDPSTLAAPAPAAGQNPDQPREAKVMVPNKAPRPAVNGDILGQLGVQIDNEYGDSPYGITDADIRAAADVSYNRLGIADSCVKGVKLVVRDSDVLGEASTTQWRQDHSQVIVTINGLNWDSDASHEMTHVLMGCVAAEERLPGFLAEFISEAAEVSPDWFPVGKTPLESMTYDELNVPTLGIGKDLSGASSTINANGAPLDGPRYDLLRMAAIKIGPAKHRELAKAIYAMAANSTKPTTLDQVKPLFDQAGIGDCVLFHETTAPGLYVDVAFRNDGMPVILYKSIDSTGVESSFPATLRAVWRKDGKPLAKTEGMTNPLGMLVDDANAPFAAMSDEYDVTIGTTTYVYKVDRVTPGAANTSTGR